MSNLLHRVSQNFNKSDSPPEPSRDTTAGIARNPPLNGIPRNILAFRTITKLLSLIQQERVFEVSYSRGILLPEDRLELKLTNAFSTLAVIEHEVVAVVTKHTRELLQVIACTQTSINQGPLTTPLPSGPMSQVWHLLFTQNYRRSDAETAIHSTAEATISEAKILAGIDFDDDRTLKLYVDEYW